MWESRFTSDVKAGFDNQRLQFVSHLPFFPFVETLDSVERSSLIWCTYFSDASAEARLQKVFIVEASLPFSSSIKREDAIFIS